MVNGKAIAVVAISAMILLAAYLFFSLGNAQQSGNTIKVVGTGSSVMPNVKTVEMTDTGFSPSALAISAGDTVEFANTGSGQRWPVSSEFNPGQSIAPGESWSFTFYDRGTWEFHDSMNDTLAGTITVK
jgi:plastocyanin